MLLVYTRFYDSTVGTVCYSPVGQISSTGLADQEHRHSEEHVQLVQHFEYRHHPFYTKHRYPELAGKSWGFRGSLCYLYAVRNDATAPLLNE